MGDVLSWIVPALTGAVTSVAVVIWLLKTSTGTLIEATIKHEFDKRAADYKEEIELRRRAQLVAELLAEWMAAAPGEVMTSEQRKRLNRLSFESTLWLPEEISVELSKVLQKSPDAPSHFDVLLRVRKYLSGEHNLTTAEVTHWPREKELPNEGLPEGVVPGVLEVSDVFVEANGERSDIDGKVLIDGFSPPAGTFVCFEIAQGNEAVVIKSDSVKFLKMQSESVCDTGERKMKLHVHPNSMANEINLKLMQNIDGS